jgi:hypothetical protein
LDRSPVTGWYHKQRIDVEKLEISAIMDFGFNYIRTVYEIRILWMNLKR